MIVGPAWGVELDWICQRTGCVFTPNAVAIKAMDRYGRTRGMVAYDGWTKSAVQAHMAVDTPIAWRHLIRPAFAFPFEQHGRSIIYAVIQASNQRSLQLAVHFGFVELHHYRDAWAVGEDIVVLEMRKENCRWLSGQSGEQKGGGRWGSRSPLLGKVAALAAFAPALGLD